LTGESLLGSGGQVNLDDGAFLVRLYLELIGVPLIEELNQVLPTLIVTIRGVLDESAEMIEMSGEGVISSGFLAGTMFSFVKSGKPVVPSGKICSPFYIDVGYATTIIGNVTVTPIGRATCTVTSAGLKKQVRVHCRAPGAITITIKFTTSGVPHTRTLFYTCY